MHYLLKCFSFLLFLAIFLNAQPKAIKLATTTSTENSGLLSTLLPEFTKKTGIVIHVIAVGSGKAIKLGQNGDVDLLLVHSPKSEHQFVEDGFGVNRRDVMYNDFVITGPSSDPAKIKSKKIASEAFKSIAEAKAPFISRADESGTHVKEKELWALAGFFPSTPWYIEAGQGMEAVLMMSDQKHSYTLTDRGTFIAIEKKVNIKILFEGDSFLFNPYGIIAVNPGKFPHVNFKESVLFINWITSPEGKNKIASFKQNGKQLFFPVSGTKSND